jgi:hypothetical protein
MSKKKLAENPPENQKREPTEPTRAYALMDHKLGRAGTALAGGVVGGGAGAAAAHFLDKSLTMGAGVGAAVGLIVEEAGRLLVDREDYRELRAKYALKEVATLLAEYGLEDMTE